MSSQASSDSCLSVDDCVCVYSGSLQISAVIQTDEGKYECVAQNSAGIAYSYPASVAVHGTCSSLNSHLIFVGFMVYLWRINLLRSNSVGIREVIQIFWIKIPKSECSTEKIMYWVCILISFAEIKQQRQQQQPFYGHYADQLVLAGTSTGGFCWCSFTAHMPLLTATSTFRLGRRRWSSLQECYLHSRCTMGIKD